MNMNTKSGHLGAVLGVTSVVALVVLAWPTASGPLQPPPLQAAPLLADGTLGRVIVEFIAACIAAGVFGLGIKLTLARFLESRRVNRQRVSTRSASAPSVVVAFPRPADATASEFDEVRQREFVPVASLTEAAVRRPRINAAHAQRRAALTRA